MSRIDTTDVSAVDLVGKPMPPFSLCDHAGTRVDSADLVGKGPLVLFFYPKDESPVCTVESCRFRDAMPLLMQHGALVFGISPDDGPSHARFRARHALPFILLCDTEGVAARSFGVRKTLGLIPGRETFVIDREGIVRWHLRSALRPARHVDGALAAVRALR